MPAHAQTRYADALEKQSVRDIPATFGDTARNEWDKAYRAWLEFGQFEWPAFRYENLMVRIDDATNKTRFEKLSEPQQYWTSRWADQTNYRFWKDRALAEGEREGVTARRNFYEGLKALKAANFPLAVEKYREGLDVWAKVLDRHPVYREDDQTHQETRHTVRRYLLALKQIGEKEPETYPFMEWVKGQADEYNPDPFNQLEMIRTSNTTPIKPPTP